MAIPEFHKYKIPVFWDDEYKRLNYTQEAFNDPESVAKWTAQGFGPKFTGSMCDMSNPQPNWNSKFVDIYSELGWRDIGTSYYRMDSGTVLPNHSDKYVKYIELFNLKGLENTIRRAIVFLEDWSSGHYSECAGEPYVNWHAGDVVEWYYDIPHIAANLGTAPRYTLQITGHV
jgi:hypothetical protein